MMRVKVLVPFNSKATGKKQVPNDIIEVTDEQLAAIREVNVNMVLVLGEAEEKGEKKPKEKEKGEKKPKAKTTK